MHAPSVQELYLVSIVYTITNVCLLATLPDDTNKMKDGKINNIYILAHPILTASPETERVSPSSPKIVYRRPPNLKQILTTTGPISPLPLKPVKCNRPRCKTCPIFDPSLSFVHPVTNKTYSFRHSGSCISSNLVYLLLSNLCSAFYVGVTQTTLTYRINNHRYSSRS